jgi:hypothetical protein
VPPEQVEDDRAAVLDIVGAFFSDSEESKDHLLWGPLLDWSRLIGPVSWSKRFETRITLAGAEIVELTATHAVVDVHAQQTSAVVRGSHTDSYSFDGPAVLEKVGTGWRLVDFSMDGRRRLDALVCAPLAEQERGGVTVRVLGVDRTVQSTGFVVDVVNAGKNPVRVRSAFALFETATAWARLNRGSNESIASGESGTVFLASAHTVELTDSLLAIALDVRTTSRRLPFRLKVPVAPPETLIPQRAPRLLPLMRSTWPRSLVAYVALTVGAAWWYGWLAIAVPLYVGLSVYRSIRVTGRLPERLHSARHVLDVSVALCAFLILWETPAVNLAVPAAVAGFVYLALRPLRRRREETRVVLALSVGAAWLFLLGLSDGPLSPCRIADGTPASIADSFAHALLTRNLARAHGYESNTLWCSTERLRRGCPTRPPTRWSPIVRGSRPSSGGIGAPI